MHARKTKQELGHVILLTAVVLGALALFTAGKVIAEERQFLVVPATSPKQFGNNGGVPAGGLPNPETIRQQYFSDDGRGSFAEYWEEVSYGDVTINGDSTDWVNLPWPITMPPDLMNQFFGVDGAEDDARASKELYFWQNIQDYGTSEEFFGSHTSPTNSSVYKPGETFLDVNNNGVWDGQIDESANIVDNDEDGIPDGRGPWIDLNRNGDCENDANNCVYLPNQDNDQFPDCCPDGDCIFYSCPPTQWSDYFDCNGNYIPDICDVAYPQGRAPSGMPAMGAMAECQALINELQAEGFDMAWLNDNQDLWGKSHDQFPIDPDTLMPSEPDGIPDECQFGLVQAAAMAASEADDLSVYNNDTTCVGDEVCPEIQNQEPPIRCEFDDQNGNNECNAVEPFENYMRRLGGISDLGEVEWIIVDEDYIRSNYPGDTESTDALIAESFDERILFGSHGGPGMCQAKPRIVDGFILPCDEGCEAGRDGDECRIMSCALPEGFLFPCLDEDEAMDAMEEMEEEDGEPECNPNIILEDYCIAGFHSDYHAPDSWIEGSPSFAGESVGAIPGPANEVGDGLRQPFVRSTKIVVTDTIQTSNGRDLVTPAPSWLPRLWNDRYGSGTPNFNTSVEIVGELGDPLFGYGGAPTEPGNYFGIGRRTFVADRGGLNGDGSGWPGSSANCGGQPNIDFRPQPRPNFVSYLGTCTPAMLPYEFRNGAAGPPDYFDGYVEFDDMASSKYHRAGDLRLGEITSPSPASFTIWGEDIGTNEPGALAVQDGFITAAGPYATDIHGNGNFDAGNQQNIELATWRGTDNCFAWEDEMTFNGYSRNHPYADVGFRDFNLDGMLDLGWTRSQQTENYMYGPPLAVGSPAPRSYPFDRQRLVEDAIEVVDRLLDFDDFVDTNALDAVNCTKGAVQSDVPNHYVDADTPSDLIPDGVLSGIVLLPDLDGTIPTADDGLPVTRAWWFNEIGYFPIHNEDNDNPAKSLGSDGDISWNLFFHNFVRTLGDTAYLNKPVDCPNEFQTNSAAYAYLQTWEGLPTLFDPDIFSNAAQANNPMAIWDQMSDGCLNHTQPIFKESPCTEWIDPVDLRTVLRPGVSSTITIPPYETVRDRNAYFLENPASLGERYYFYSVGQGFDADLPGDGLLVVHTDVGANPESLPNGQQNATRFAYVIEQADGLDQLGAPIASPEANFGDAGDPFPGDSFKREFNLDSDPAAVWYAQESWTGLDVMDIQPDGQGSVALTLTWTPTSIPSLRFVDPPGGASTDGVYRIRVEATDVRGGTTIEVYSTKADEFTSVNDGSNSVTLIDSIQKVNPGTRLITFDWDVSGLDDDTYFLFAKLVPGRGADGEFEREFTEPVPGRNNRGDGTLTVQDVNIERDKARLETWTMELVNVLPDGTQDWIVFGSLSQPQPDEFASDQDPFPHLFVDPITNKGQYTSIDEEVTFTLDYTIPASESAVGDTWTFVTTGITAVSSPVTVLEGEVDEAPRAVVSATPQSPRPGEIVRFDARGSTDPNGEPLDYEWNFGDGTPPTFGAVVQHTYTQPGQFTATLKATNVNSGLFSEDRLEIIVFNNRPTASFDAFPTSGSRPLTVSFDASDSSDQESNSDDLIYEWDFGDGEKANVAKAPGVFVSTEHVYIADAEGKLCSPDDPCRFEARLTVTDLSGAPGSKTDEAIEVIWVGNTTPDPIITSSALSGGDPLTVRFNASASVDPDNQDLKVTWQWGDGSADQEFDAVAGDDGVGNVTHTYERRTNEDVSQFTTTATVSDGVAEAQQTFRITVREPSVSSSLPTAEFVLNPTRPEVGSEFEADASASFDRPNGFPSEYIWNWGDGTPDSNGVIARHTYAEAGVYTITLTVRDAESPANEDTKARVVDLIRTGDDGEETGNNRPVAELSVNQIEGFAGFTEFTFDASESSDADGDDLAYSWSFGDGTPRDTRQIATHVFDEPGEYRVSLTVRDTSNAADDTFINITVLDNSDNREPVPMIGTGPRSGTAPLTLTFDGQLSFDPDGDQLDYRWEFIRDGVLVDSSMGGVVTQLFDEAGTYSVILEVADGRGGIARTEPEIVSVAARATDDGDGSENPIPDDGDDDDAPAPICGLGAATAAFGSLLGLTMLRLAGMGRQRRRRELI